MGNSGSGRRSGRCGRRWPSQRCWNHKLLNVLDQLPQKVRPEARALLQAIPAAPTRAEAERRRDAFAKRYRRWYPKAVVVLERDWERLVTFYEFPEPHWRHLRTTNVIESPFAAVRLRTSARSPSAGSGSSMRRNSSPRSPAESVVSMGSSCRRSGRPPLDPHLHTY
jgi:transposase-like protein